MDTTISALRREAATGDPAAEARLLVARLRAAPVCERCEGYGTANRIVVGGRRYATGEGPCPPCAGTGSPFRARLELAAYCGSEAARAVCPDAHLPIAASTFARHERHEAFAGFVSGLSRWADVGPVPGWVRRRAALAASAVAHEAWWDNHKTEHHSMPDFAPGLCCYGPNRVLRAARDALLRDEPSPRFDAVWVRAFVEASPPEDPLEWLVAPEAGAPPEWSVRDEIAVAWNEAVPGHAARLAGEAPVRAAISSALIAWALA